MSSRIRKLTISATAFAAFAVTACSPPPAPRKTLSTEDKTADLYWLYSQFNENYAPLELKQQKWGFNYEQLKAKYLQEAATTKNNDEFYSLLYRFVSEFKDAHTSASLPASSLPVRSKVAYLGFSGKRAGDALVVTELLPTTKADSGFPVKLNDKITKLDGAPLKEVVTKEMVQWRDLGQNEANYTYHFSRIFNRVSTTNGLPARDFAVLTILREKKELQVVLPWVVKDLYAFNREQKDATKKNDTPEEALLGQVFQLGFLRWDGKIEAAASISQKLIRGLPNFSFWNTFQFVDTSPTWFTRLENEVAAASGSAPISGLELLAKERSVPANAIPIAEAKTYPTYVTREKVLNAEGKDTGTTKFVAYMYLNTFSPSSGEETVLKEVQATLDKLKEFGTTDLVIDMINNGGGSLTLGMKLAQVLSKEKVIQPDIQFRISETWLDEFEKASLMADSDAERELNRRAVEALKEDLAAGKRLSRRVNVEALQPFGGFVGNEKLESKLNIVLMVNEMCASMCDIFAGIMKDNGLAKIVGSKTMGAGGNVVEHYAAPNSHLAVRQTESLIVRNLGKNDGRYIENDGLDPDLEVKVNESTMEKYVPVRTAALKLLLTESK